MTLGSFGVVRFVPVRPGGPLCSLWVVVIVRVRPGCRWVRSASLGSLECAMGVVGFIWGRCVCSGTPWGLFVFVWDRLVRTWKPLGVFWFIRVVNVRTGGNWVHSGRWVRLGAPMGHLGSLRAVWFVCVHPWGSWVHTGS